MVTEIKIDEIRDIIAKVGEKGFKVYADYLYAYNTLNHKPSIDEVHDISTLDKNTIITYVGALKEHKIIKEKTPQEEVMDVILESETDDLIQKTINTFLVGGGFTSSSVRDLCIQTITQFINDKIQNNPTKEAIYKASLSKKLDLISRI